MITTPLEATANKAPQKLETEEDFRMHPVIEIFGFPGEAHFVEMEGSNPRYKIKPQRLYQDEQEVVFFGELELIPRHKTENESPSCCRQLLQYHNINGYQKWTPINKESDCHLSSSLIA